MQWWRRDPTASDVLGETDGFESMPYQRVVGALHLEYSLRRCHKYSRKPSVLRILRYN